MVSKIHIIGGPGCGKSFLARKFSEKLDISTFDLDDIFWCNDKNTFGIEAKPEVRDKDLKSILKKKKWIIEGVYGGWTKPSFKEAELIIILQPKTRVRQWRITERFLKRKLCLTKNKKKETWKSFFGLLKWSKRYYIKNFPGIYKQIEPFKDKTLTITKPRITVDEILALTDSK